MGEVFTIAFPVFSLVLIGYLFGKIEVLNDKNAKALNDYVYYIALPALLFYQTAKTPITELLNYPFILAALFSNISVLFISLFIGKSFFNQSLKCASLYAFSATFSNVGFMGIPLFIAAFGNEGSLPAVLMAIVGNTVVLGCVIMLLEASEKSRNSTGEIVVHSVLSLLKNPIVLGSLFGILIAASSFDIPVAANNLFSMIAQSAAPVALFSIGLSIIGLTVNISFKELFSLVILKIFAFPLITFLIVTYVFPLEKFWADSAIILSALPTGALAYVVSQKYDLYVTESSSVFLVTTLISVVTLPLLLYIYL